MGRLDGRVVQHNNTIKGLVFAKASSLPVRPLPDETSQRRSNVLIVIFDSYVWAVGA